MKHVKRLTAMTLVLAFIFLLSTSAFAAGNAVDDQSAGPHHYEDISVSIRLTGGIESATATMTFTESDDPIYDATTSFNGTLTITYIYCREDQQRPSNYITKTVTKSFTEAANGNVFTLTTNAIPSDSIMIQATCVYRATITLQNATVYYTTADLTVYLD